MDDDGYIAKIDRPHASLDYHWAVRIKNKPLPKPLKLSGYEHARLIGDVYVALSLTGLPLVWKQNKEKHRTLEEDIETVFNGSKIYWEVDCATEHPGVIASKASRYMKLTGVFHVIFVAPNSNRAEEILDELPRNRGTQFVVTLYEYLKLDPLMKGYVSANQPTEFQLLQDIQSGVRTRENVVASV